MIELRPYQSDLVQAIRGSFAKHRRVLAVAPTGSGKTVVFTYIANNASTKGKRITIVAHRQEITDQISRALDGMGVRHGRIAPGHTMTDDPVQVAMIQTLARRLPRVPEPDMLIVDEAHHGVAGTWRTVSDAWQRAFILGVTATPQRLDGRGLGDAFDDMVLGPTMSDLIEGGFLAGYDYLAPPQQADLSNIRTRGGDFAVDELAAIMDRSVITGDAVQHYRQYLNGRPAIVFCVTVAHAEHVAQQFVQAGFRAASVDGSMDRLSRADRIAAIGDGRLNVLTSCELISEGTDIPVVSGAILLRPTKSLSMFLQQVGRALRPKPDGSRAVILDHVGNVHRHGMPDMPREWSLTAKKRKKSAAAPVATCETCYRAFSVYPGWKDQATCNDDQPAGCILSAPAPARDLPEHVDGQLMAVSMVRPWSGGIRIDAARGRDWFNLLRLADTPDKLREIAKARGYRAGWVHHILKERAGRRIAA